MYAAVAGQGVLLLRRDATIVARTPAGRGGKAESLARDGAGNVWAPVSFE
jgi:hypothetical protein